MNNELEKFLSTDSMFKDLMHAEAVSKIKHNGKFVITDCGLFRLDWGDFVDLFAEAKEIYFNEIPLGLLSYRNLAKLLWAALAFASERDMHEIIVNSKGSGLHVTRQSVK